MYTRHSNKICILNLGPGKQYDHTKDGVDVKKAWTSKHTDAVNKLKHTICSYPILRQYDHTKPIVVVSDASDYAIGGALIQYYGDDPCAVAYASRRLSAAEKNYSVQEKECLAIKYCLGKFKHYVLATNITVKCLSDHQSLQYLTKGHPINGQAGGRIARWAHELSGYDYKIEYLPGKKNVVGDILSRLISAEDASSESNRPRDTSDSLIAMTPETQRASAIYYKASNHLLHEERRNDPPEGSLHHQPGAADTNKLLEGLHEMEHESVFFIGASFGNAIVKIEKHHYMRCPDFALIFQALSSATDQHDLHDEITKGLETNNVRTAYEGKKTLTPSVYKPPPEVMQQYSIHNGLLYRTSTDYTDRLCVPDTSTSTDEGEETLRQQFVNHVHNNSLHVHLGQQRTIYEVKRRATWPHMTVDTNDIISRCDQCQRNKTNRKRYQGPLQTLSKPIRPGTHYSVDFVTPLPRSGHKGYDQLFVIVDRYSKFTWLIPTHTTADAKITAEQFISNVVYTHGIATEITSDQDVRFRHENGFWQQFFNFIGTSLILSSARHQNTNGTAERQIAHVEELMRMGINYQQDNWVSLLPRIQFTMNTTIAAQLGYSPYFIERGRQPSLPLDVDVATRQNREPPENTKDFTYRIWVLDDTLRERRQAIDIWRAKHADQRRRHVDERIQVGSMVWLSTKDITLPWDKERRTKKLRQQYYGPFEVLQQTSPVSFRLKLPEASHLFPIFHANLLLPASDVNRHGERRQPLPAVSPEDSTYEVEGILAKRVTNGGKTEYLVHWKSYLYEEATWEPETNLNGCNDLLLKFEAKYGHDQLQHAGTPVSTKRALEIAKEASKKKRKNANTTSS